MFFYGDFHGDYDDNDDGIDNDDIVIGPMAHAHPCFFLLELEPT